MRHPRATFALEHNHVFLPAEASCDNTSSNLLYTPLEHEACQSVIAADHQDDNHLVAATLRR